MAEFGVPRSRGDRQEARRRGESLAVDAGAAGDLTRELTAAGSRRCATGSASISGGDRRQPWFLAASGVHGGGGQRQCGQPSGGPHPPLSAAPDPDQRGLLALLPGELVAEPLGSHALKGLPEPRRLYGLQGLDEEDDPGAVG